jgi:integrase
MLIDYIAKMKTEGLSTSYINVTLAAIKHLCVMNDIIINSKKINKFVGEPTKLQEDRPYTREEIHQLLNVCDLRMRALVLLLASTGMRIGALPSLKVGDISDVLHTCGTDHSNGGRVTVYAGTKDKYITFMTPECRKAVNDYLEFRKKSGERINEDSPLIREQFDIDDLGKIRNAVHPLCRDNYSNILRHTLVKAGLRIVNHSYGGRHRHKISISNGFRKFFSNQLIEADIKTEYRWLMEGHDLKGNDKYYVRITEQKLYEEYQKAIPFLTIDPSQRLQRELAHEKAKNTETSKILARLAILESEIGIKI